MPKKTKTKRDVLVEMMASLTGSQLTDVADYILEKGVRWKSELNLDWSRASARVRGEHSAPLQQIRNNPNLGPDWLHMVTTADVQAEAGRRVLAEDKPKSAPEGLFSNDSIQFPRLLAEINALGLSRAQLNDLCASMDLRPDEVAQLFERAEREWERIKEGTRG